MPQKLSFFACRDAIADFGGNSAKVSFVLIDKQNETETISPSSEYPNRPAGEASSHE
jgi:hypothetical protein